MIHFFTAEILNLDAWGYYLKEEAPTLIVEAVRQTVRGDGQPTRSHSSARLISKLDGIE